MTINNLRHWHSEMVTPVIDKLAYEKKYWQTGIQRIAGVDEVGRGPLAGPVVAAAIIFSPEDYIDGVDDSKKLSHQDRITIYPVLIERCLDYGVGIVTAAEIDQINIYQATMLAMRKALGYLKTPPEYVLVDGKPMQKCPFPQTAIVKGDSRSFTIGAASVLAKVVRDFIMLYYHRDYPEYGFDRHKGYPTRVHLNALQQTGPCVIHRRSFGPCAPKKKSSEK